MSATAQANRRKVSPEFNTMCFSVFAHAEASTLPKLCTPIAKRGLIMSRLYACVVDDGAEMQIDFQVEDMSQASADQIAKTLRQFPDVTCVLVSEKG